MISKEEFSNWLHDSQNSVLHPEGCTYALYKITCEDTVFLYFQKCISGRPVVSRGLEYMALYDTKSQKMIGSIRTCFYGFLAPECRELIECDNGLINIVIKDRVSKKIREYAVENEEMLMEKAHAFIAENNLQSYFNKMHESRYQDVENENFVLGLELILDVPAYDYTVKSDKDVYAFLHDEDAFIQKVFEDFINSYESCVYPFGDDRCTFGFDVAMGLRLIAYHKSQMYLEQLKRGYNKKLLKRRDVVRAASELYKNSEGNIVNVKVGLRRKSSAVEFTYPLEYLSMGMTPISAVSGTVNKKAVSDFVVPETPSDFDMNSIYHITYRNRVIYTDAQSLE